MLPSILKVSFFAMLVAGNATAASSTTEHPKQEPPTVVCFGDSITYAGYPAELEKILPVRVINAGIRGNSSRQGLARLERDVLKHQPDAVVVLFGTNDTRLDAPHVHVPLPEYERNLTEIVDRCRQIGAKVVLATMPPINPEPYFKRHKKEVFDAAGGLENLIQHYRSAVLRVAEAQEAAVVDLNQLLVEERDWLAADGVHPTPEGNRIIARLVSQQLKLVLEQE